MNNKVKSLFDDVKRFYESELSSALLPNGNRRSSRDESIICLIAVAWVLERRKYPVKWFHNDYYPCISIDQVYYDTSVPEGTTETKELYHGSIGQYRESDLYIVYDTYVGHDFDGTDFINAFSISHGGAIFPYSPKEELQ